MEKVHNTVTVQFYSCSCEHMFSLEICHMALGWTEDVSLSCMPLCLSPIPRPMCPAVVSNCFLSPYIIPPKAVLSCNNSDLYSQASLVSVVSLTSFFSSFHSLSFPWIRQASLYNHFSNKVWLGKMHQSTQEMQPHNTTFFFFVFCDLLNVDNKNQWLSKTCRWEFLWGKSCH